MGRFKSLAPLLIAVMAVSVMQVAYAAAGVAPSALGAVLPEFALALAFILWIEADARRRRIVPCHDFGFLVAVFFPVSLLWYAVWSRGWRGLLTLLALLGLMLVPPLLAIVAWIVRSALA